jgi:hypothetical protein
MRKNLIIAAMTCLTLAGCKVEQTAPQGFAVPLPPPGGNWTCFSRNTLASILFRDDGSLEQTIRQTAPEMVALTTLSGTWEMEEDTLTMNFRDARMEVVMSTKAQKDLRDEEKSEADLISDLNKRLADRGAFSDVFTIRDMRDDIMILEKDGREQICTR